MLAHKTSWLFICLHCITLLVFQESARRIGKVSEEAKLEIDVETYVESFKPHIMDVVFAWANGASFSQICKMTDAFEGTVEPLLSGHTY